MTTLPSTTTLDAPSRGGPAEGIVDLIAGPNVATELLDVPSRGGPAEWIQPASSAPAATFTVAGPGGVTTVPSGHAGDIVLTLTGTGTAWDGTTVFTPSGVANVVKVTQSVSDATTATITITTGAGTGTLTITESVTGVATDDITIAAASFTRSPTSLATSSVNNVITLVGTNTLWDVDTAVFTLSGGTGASLHDIVITDDTHATVEIDAGSAIDTLTITDPTTGATQTLTVSNISMVVTSPARLVANATGQTVVITGTGTSWVDGVTVFSVAGVTGAAVTGQSITGQVATLTVTASTGGNTGTLTFSNSLDASTATLTVIAVATGITVSGPTTGTPGSPSTYTVGLTPAGSGFALSVTMTFNIGMAANAFDPSEVVVLPANTVSPTDTVDYTPLAGTDTVSTIVATNNRGLTDAAEIELTAIMAMIPGVSAGLDGGMGMGLDGGMGGGGRIGAARGTLVLPQNLLKTVPAVYENFETTGDWTTLAGTIAANTSEFLTGTQSMKLSSDGTTNTPSMRKAFSPSISFPTFASAFNVYIHAFPAGTRSLRIRLWSNPDVKGLETIQNVMVGVNRPPGWQRIQVRGVNSVNWTAIGGGITSDAIVAMDVAFLALASGQSLSIDSFEHNIDSWAAFGMEFHDNWRGQYDYAFPMFRARGITGSLVTNTTGGNAPGGANTWTWANFTEMINAGWTPTNHTDDHAQIVGVSQATAETHIAACTTAMLANGATAPIETFTPPNAAYDANGRAAMIAQGILMNLFSASSGSESSMSWPAPDMYGLTGLITYQSTAHTLARLAENLVRGTTFYSLGHNVVVPPPTGLREVLDYCRANQIPVLNRQQLLDMTRGPLEIPAQW